MLEDKPAPQVVYEDDALLVCLKPAGVAVEGGAGESLPALLQPGRKSPLYPVHRLDQPVGGFLLLAKTPAAAAALSAGELKKGYLAVVAGVPQPAAGELHHLLYHDTRTNKTFAVQRRRRGVREAALVYQTLATVNAAYADSGARPGKPTDAVWQDGMVSLVAIRLITGRTHQIRAQFAAEGHPLAGDGRYGSRLKGQLALFGAMLGFTHPASGRALRYCTAPPQAGWWRLFNADMLQNAAADMANGTLP